MAAARIVEPVDILEDSPFRLATCVPVIAPDQLCLDGFEKRLDHGIVHGPAGYCAAMHERGNFGNQGTFCAVFFF